MSSELEKICGGKYLICCFGGMGLKLGGILPFEFLNYLSINYENKCDLLFYIDKNQCCYHKGLHEITSNIKDTVKYLNNKINNGQYEKVIFIGVSAGGYASILFGSLCNNVTNVISFIPKIKLDNPIDKTYTNLKDIINPNVDYILFGDISIKNISDAHHISQCHILKDIKNVDIIEMNGVNLKVLRDDGTIKKIIDSIIF